MSGHSAHQKRLPRCYGRRLLMQPLLLLRC